ncbi:alpha-tocopherol transfer protein [Drosophila grimshawi]|uniref:GH22857 n=1 Tax=Drosophila grimshawi TaxID=7222 RepID=B4JVX2_DROGR|nr:alpha-tocopherol transfer protein [Drosophila grimshawi]EDV98110.1 GH22857 [Drosophila grimshawi]
MAEELIRPLSAELRHIAATELNEVEQRLPQDLQALRDWLAKQPHLKARQDAQFLVAFLRGCKFSLEKAKSKLDHYYTIRTMMPEVFGQNYMDDRSIAFCRTGTYVRLPKPLGVDGPRIQLTDYSKLDPKVFQMIDLFRFETLVMGRQITEDDNSVISGYVEILDLSKWNLSMVAQLDFSLIKKMGVFAEKAAPMRMKGVHLVNCPKEAVAVLNLARSLMPNKLQDRFYVHKNIEQLSKIIPREYLPEEYGGSNGRIADIIVEMERQMLSYNDYLKDEMNYGVNEQLRPGKHLTPDTLFGIEGSFRKLDID